MSRNLSTDRCKECGHGPVRIEDLFGKPIEFRAYSKYVPVIGARWDCPNCGTAYFAAYKTRGDCVSCHIAGLYPPDYPGTWEIDLSYWSTYDDECDDALKKGAEYPKHLCTHGREEQRFPLS